MDGLFLIPVNDSPDTLRGKDNPKCDKCGAVMFGIKAFSDTADTAAPRRECVDCEGK